MRSHLQPPCATSCRRLVCLVIYSPDNQKQQQQTANDTAAFVSQAKNRKSGFCPLEMASKKHLVSCVFSNPILMPPRVPHAGLRRCSRGVGKRQRSGGEVPAGSRNTLICRHSSAAPIPRLIPLRSPLVFRSLSLHFYHLLILPSGAPTFFLPLCHSVCRPVCLRLLLAGRFSHLLLPFSLQNTCELPA